MDWKIVQLECKPQDGALANVATNAHWTLTDTDGNNTTSVYGSVALGEADPENFIDFAELDEATVVGWVQAAMGEEQVTAHESNVAAQLAAAANPAVVTPALPWVTA